MNGGDHGLPVDQLRQLLLEVVSETVLPELDRLVSERLDVDALTQQVVAQVRPLLSQDVQRIINDFDQRLGRMEHPSPSTPPVSPQPVAQMQTPPDSGEARRNTAEHWVSMIDTAAEAVFKRISEWKFMELMGKRDVAWAQTLARENPMLAGMYAQMLNPNIMLPQQQALDFMAAGARAGLSLRQSMMGGGLSSPASSSGGSFVPSGSTPGMPSVGSGVQMQGRRSGNGRRITKRLSDLLGEIAT